MAPVTACGATIARSIAETQAVAAALAAQLEPGDVVCLVGDLGAGKTYFTKGLVAGLGGDAAEVTSPTFVLMQTYRAGRASRVEEVFHFDAYRLHAAGDLVDIGLDDALAAGGVTVIEWADRVAEALPAERFEVRLRPQPGGETERRIAVCGCGAGAAARVTALIGSDILATDEQA